MRKSSTRRKLLITAGVIMLVAVFVSCGSKNNVIQGLITHYDNVLKSDLPVESADIYLYKSIVVRQDHPDSYLKKTVGSLDGYYSLSSLANGPYYMYVEKLDTNGHVLYSGGTSTNVAGHETKVVNFSIH